MESTNTWYLYGETGQTLVPVNQDSVQKNRLRTSQTLKHKLWAAHDQRRISHVLHPKNLGEKMEEATGEITLLPNT